MKQLIKKILGKNIKIARKLYHGQKARLVSLKNGFPAKKLVTVGITGTKGKTSTTILTGELLRKSGVKVGYISTAQIFDGEKVFENPFHMTTIDAGEMQKLLKKMVKNGVEVVILEMSSQGMEQGRHLGLGGFDIAVFLNIFPEHIESHGSFENYLKAKQILFKNLRKNGVGIINKNSEQHTHFDLKKNALFVDYLQQISIKNEGIFKNISYKNKDYKTHFQADFEVQNAWIATNICVQVAKKLGQDLKIEQILEKMQEQIAIPGRMEWVYHGQNFDILVDYAHEPASMENLLKTLSVWQKNGFYDKIIHVVSCDGAGRDDWKKPIMGKFSFDFASNSIYTTDNYEAGDNPEKIVEMLLQNISKKDLQNAQKSGKIVKNIDRKIAFEEALKIAKKYADENQKTLIVSTGVGNENGLFRPDGKIDWNEKKVWQKLVKSR